QLAISRGRTSRCRPQEGYAAVACGCTSSPEPTLNLLADVHCGTLRAMRAAAVVVLCAGLAVQAEEIRIEVARGQRAARIEAGGRNHALAVADSVLTVDGKAVASAEFPGPVRVDGRELPGRLEVFIDRGALVAVNAVDLEQYVAAVVASEVPPKWPAGALRAQAVAARTFAVAQTVAQGPAARAHLGASILDQVYRNAARTPRPALEAARAAAGGGRTWGAAPIPAPVAASSGRRR